MENFQRPVFSKKVNQENSAKPPFLIAQDLREETKLDSEIPLTNQSAALPSFPQTQEPNYQK